MTIAVDKLIIEGGFMIYDDGDGERLSVDPRLPADVIDLSPMSLL